MLNMRGYGRSCESTSSWGLGVGAKLQKGLAAWSSKAMKKEPWGQINREGMELLLPHPLGLWHSRKGIPLWLQGEYSTTL